MRRAITIVMLVAAAGAARGEDEVRERAGEAERRGREARPPTSRRDGRRVAGARAGGPRPVDRARGEARANPPARAHQEPAHPRAAATTLRAARRGGGAGSLSRGGGGL